MSCSSRCERAVHKPCIHLVRHERPACVPVPAATLESRLCSHQTSYLTHDAERWSRDRRGQASGSRVRGDVDMYTAQTQCDSVHRHVRPIHGVPGDVAARDRADEWRPTAPRPSARTHGTKPDEAADPHHRCVTTEPPRGAHEAPAVKHAAEHAQLARRLADARQASRPWAGASSPVRKRTSPQRAARGARVQGRPRAAGAEAAAYAGMLQLARASRKPPPRAGAGAPASLD